MSGGVFINRDRKRKTPDAPLPVPEEAFKHAVKYSFVHEDQYNNCPPEFWSKNVERLPCVYDHQPFDGPIYSVPIDFRSRTNTWTVRGIYCSLHCAKKHMLTNREFNSRNYTLFSCMVRMVYGCAEDVEPASDIETLLYDKTMTLEMWRSLPKQHVEIRLCVKEFLPFRMENRNVVAHPLTTHPASAQLEKWNTIQAEAASLPPVVLDEEERANEENEEELEEEEEEEEEEDDDGVVLK